MESFPGNLPPPPLHTHTITVEPVLKGHPIGHKNVVCQDRWSLVTGSVIWKCRSFCRKCVVCQDRWSFMPVVSQDRFHCTIRSVSVNVCKTTSSSCTGNRTGYHTCTLRYSKQLMVLLENRNLPQQSACGDYYTQGEPMFPLYRYKILD